MEALQQPISAAFGPETGPAAIVMAPMMAVWDNGAFCAPLTEQLVARGYRVTVYDTMSLARDCDDLPQAAARWAAVLAERHFSVELAVGQAYGGALVQYLLGGALSACPRFLGISAPTYCDGPLRAGLGDILRLLRDSSPEAALQMLEWRVLADHSDTMPARPEQAPDEAAARLAPGLSHLLDADARAEVAAYGGRALWLYGEGSRLVRGSNIVPAPRRAHQRAVGLPDCGMRPLSDAQAESIALIEAFLDESTI
ncbi:hypothetical protein [Chromobacterium amazonense]|uniref:Alpha/beta hydrolase n=1 Tax=Chromobacterium amazonense TaxID=1382803 RepID=A0ABU8V2A1_9NEIS|nr:hypothetical protein [Chromobacterium amazonense]MDQ4540069.1 hypothetical protein [Chromobacterium amazonense]